MFVQLHSQVKTRARVGHSCSCPAQIAAMKPTLEDLNAAAALDYSMMTDMCQAFTAGMMDVLEQPLPEDLGTLAEASAYAHDTTVYLEDPGEEPSPTEAPTSPEVVEVAHPGEEPSPTEAPTEAPTDAQTDPYMDIPQRLERCRRIAVESAAKVARTDGPPTARKTAPPMPPHRITVELRELMTHPPTELMSHPPTEKVARTDGPPTDPRLRQMIHPYIGKGKDKGVGDMGKNTGKGGDDKGRDKGPFFDDTGIGKGKDKGFDDKGKDKGVSDRTKVKGGDDKGKDKGFDDKGKDKGFDDKGQDKGKDKGKGKDDGKDNMPFDKSQLKRKDRKGKWGGWETIKRFLEKHPTSKKPLEYFLEDYKSSYGPNGRLPERGYPELSDADIRTRAIEYYRYKIW